MRARSLSSSRSLSLLTGTLARIRAGTGKLCASTLTRLATGMSGAIRRAVAGCNSCTPRGRRREAEATRRMRRLVSSYTARGSYGSVTADRGASGQRRARVVFGNRVAVAPDFIVRSAWERENRRKLGLDP